MPRPNQPRSIAGESALARRIAQEREAKGMSFRALAIQMEHRGCPINSSALLRIEKGERRITVDELLAFAEVFGVPVERMLLAPELAAREDLIKLLDVWNSAALEMDAARERHEAASEILKAKVQVEPELQPILEAVLNDWAERSFDDSHRAGAVAYHMWKFTGDEQWVERVRDEIKEG